MSYQKQKFQLTFLIHHVDIELCGPTGQPARDRLMQLNPLHVQFAKGLFKKYNSTAGGLVSESGHVQWSLAEFIEFDSTMKLAVCQAAAAATEFQAKLWLVRLVQKRPPLRTDRVLAEVQINLAAHLTPADSADSETLGKHLQSVRVKLKPTDTAKNVVDNVEIVMTLTAQLVPSNKRRMKAQHKKTENHINDLKPHDLTHGANHQHPLPNQQPPLPVDQQEFSMPAFQLRHRPLPPNQIVSHPDRLPQTESLALSALEPADPMEQLLIRSLEAVQLGISLQHQQQQQGPAALWLSRAVQRLMRCYQQQELRLQQRVDQLNARKDVFDARARAELSRCQGDSQQAKPPQLSAEAKQELRILLAERDRAQRDLDAVAERAARDKRMSALVLHSLASQQNGSEIPGDTTSGLLSRMGFALTGALGWAYHRYIARG